MSCLSMIFFSTFPPQLLLNTSGIISGISQGKEGSKEIKEEEFKEHYNASPVFARVHMRRVCLCL